MCCVPLPLLLVITLQDVPLALLGDLKFTLSESLGIVLHNKVLVQNLLWREEAVVRLDVDAMRDNVGIVCTSDEVVVVDCVCGHWELVSLMPMFCLGDWTVIKLGGVLKAHKFNCGNGSTCDVPPC